ncbi:hypothetical protein BHE74_00048973 [Ensete ventricosum]|nr:hypothetical protein BHE74_00048973 [Ensete ventricosum]
MTCLPSDHRKEDGAAEKELNGASGLLRKREGELRDTYLAGWHLCVGRRSGGCGTLPTAEMNGVGFWLH